MPDQVRFARLSGDANPMHLDPVYSRRTQAGAPVVHGIHTLLWLLDAAILAHPELGPISALRVRFRRMVYLGDVVEARIVRLTSDSLQARVVIDGVDVVSVTAALGQPESCALSRNCPTYPHLAVPRVLQFDDMASQGGAVTINESATELAVEFPHLCRLLDPRRVATLACLSYLVGMTVPGLHSIFVGLDLRATDRFDDGRSLTFQVTAVDPRFRRTEISIQGGGFAGVVHAAVRPAPVPQADMQALAALVAREEFLSSTALVIGGSRGLGELTAKLLAAGGSNVTLTYASGNDEAGRVATEIRNWGGRATAVRYDVREDARRQLEHLAAPPTQLYYFATPLIARRKSGSFDRARFAEFNDFYIDGFRNVVEAAHELRPGGIAVFYPSTQFVTTRPAEMTEYAMSKAAAEVLCADLAAYLPNVRIMAERLPRVLTDQTAGLEADEVDDPLPLMLPIVRAMHST